MIMRLTSSLAAAPKTTKTRIKLMMNSITKPCTWWSDDGDDDGKKRMKTMVIIMVMMVMKGMKTMVMTQ